MLILNIYRNNVESEPPRRIRRTATRCKLSARLVSENRCPYLVHYAQYCLHSLLFWCYRSARCMLYRYTFNSHSQLARQYHRLDCLSEVLPCKSLYIQYGQRICVVLKYILLFLFGGVFHPIQELR